MIYVVNLSQKNYIRKGSKWLPKIAEWVKTHGGGQIMPVSCEFEQTLYDLKDDADAQKGMSLLSYDWRLCLYLRARLLTLPSFTLSLYCSILGAVQGRSLGGWTQGPASRGQVDCPSFDPRWSLCSLFAVLLHGWTQGSPGLDHYEGHSSSASGGCDPY